ncbi:hypothetical protein X777_00491 [Ooceraea biroi]|uniref:Uncharacterized protein n=1 Tax=Ooceraea biroi TaxID=2015173 RepID=A0A026WW96_OOCBI|nr:hypothetical protein X777_00491 [Ooceraea biroi]
MSHVILEDIELDCNAILIAVKTLIAMSELQETQRWLNEAIRLCLQYIEQNNFQSKPIYTYLADVSKEEDLRISLRLLYRNMIGRMEKLYSASDKMDEWIETVHDCLDDRAGIINFPYGACDWSKAAIMISTYFINKLRFTEARNCLAAVEYMLERIDSSYNNCRYIVMNLTAKVANAWLAYTTNILRESYLYLQQVSNQVPNQEESQELLLLTSLDEHLADINNRITDSHVSRVPDADVIATFAFNQYQLASNTFIELDNNIDHFDSVFKYAWTLKYFGYFMTDINFQVQIYKCREMLFNDNCSKYIQKAGHVLEVVPHHLLTILEMWKEAAELLLSVIEGEAAYRDLYFTTQEKLLDIINKLDYYYEHCQQIGET